MNGTLKKGMSYLLLVAFTFIALAGGLCLGTGNPVKAAVTRYEAESATYSGGGIATDHTGYSGTGFWCWVSTVGNYLEFTVNVGSAGSRNVACRYSNATGSAKTLSVYVNNVKIKQVTFATTANWDTWANQIDSLSLNTGSNKIKYQYDSGDSGNVNIDYIELETASLATSTPTSTSTPTPAPSGSIGYTADGTSSDGVAGNYYNALRYQASSNMSVNQMRIKVSTAGTGKMKCAIYSDNAGSIGSFLKGTNERSNLATGWQTFTLTSAQSLTSGTYYWLVSWRDGSYSIASDSATAVNYWGALTYAATWPTTLPASGGQANYRHSFYATSGATPTAGPTATSTPTPRPATATATATSTPTPNGPTPTPSSVTDRYMGINVGNTADWEGNIMFADAMMSSRNWTNISDNNNAPVDSNGWPTTDGKIVVWHGITRMNGTYALSFKGQATVAAEWGTCSLSTVSYNSSTNTSTATLTYSNTDGAGLQLKFTNTKRTSGSAANTGITEVKLMRPLTQGSTSSYATSARFTNQFKNVASKFKAFRFMDYLSTNGNMVANWADRTRPTHATQGRYFGAEPDGNPADAGACWEYLVALVNETDRDAWICIPQKATDDYITKVAQLLKYGSDGNNPYTSTQASPVYQPLEAGRCVYIEFSNELWNSAWGFFQCQQNYDAATAEVNAGGSPLNYDGETGQWQWAWRRIGKRTVEISKIFRSVFGDSEMMTRIRPVLEWQQYNGQDTARQALVFIENWYNNVDGNHVTTPHPANYYIWGGSGSAYYNPDNSSDTLTIDTIWSSDTFNTANWAAPQKADASYAAAFGIKRTAYEGGPSMDNHGHSESVKLAAWNDSRMKTCLQDHHTFWEQYGGDVLMYFTIGGSDSGSYYQWNFAKNIHDPVTGSPKLQAIDTLNTGSKAAVTLGALIPSTVDGNAWAVAAGWGSPGTGSKTLSTSGDRWASYNFRQSAAASRSIIVNYTASGSATVDVCAQGVKVGTLTTSGGTGLNYTATASLPAGLTGVRLVCKSGSITINSVRVQ